MLSRRLAGVLEAEALVERIDDQPGRGLVFEDLGLYVRSFTVGRAGLEPATNGLSPYPTTP